MEETVCKSYVQHLEFLDVKAKKKIIKIRERNTPTYFLDERCNSTYQQAAENVSKAKRS